MKTTRRQNYSTNACAHCGAVYHTARSHSKYCSAACRKAAWRENRLHYDSKKHQTTSPSDMVGEGGFRNSAIKHESVKRLIRALEKSD